MMELNIFMTTQRKLKVLVSVLEILLQVIFHGKKLLINLSQQFKQGHYHQKVTLSLLF